MMMHSRKTSGHAQIIRKVPLVMRLRDDRIELPAMPTDKREATSWNNRGLWTVTEICGFDIMVV